MKKKSFMRLFWLENEVAKKLKDKNLREIFVTFDSTEMIAGFKFWKPSQVWGRRAGCERLQRIV